MGDTSAHSPEHPHMHHRPLLAPGGSGLVGSSWAAGHQGGWGGGPVGQCGSEPFPLCSLSAGWPGASDSGLLGLSFLICNMGMVTVPAPGVGHVAEATDTVCADWVAEGQPQAPASRQQTFLGCPEAPGPVTEPLVQPGDSVGDPVCDKRPVGLRPPRPPSCARRLPRRRQNCRLGGSRSLAAAVPNSTPIRAVVGALSVFRSALALHLFDR